MTVPMPGRVALLRTDHVGRPVPWFVAWIDGRPDFRVARADAIGAALRRNLCWVCGVPFQRQERRAFLVGPMCMINRVAPEPPSHKDCAVYSAMACPFLATPQMTRRERGLPEDLTAPAGVAIMRNPGVALVWVTDYRSWSKFDAPGGVLFGIGQPAEPPLWFARGRSATRAEVLASVESGYPLLLEAAETDGPGAIDNLEAARQRAMDWIPAGVTP